MFVEVAGKKLVGGGELFATPPPSRPLHPE